MIIRKLIAMAALLLMAAPMSDCVIAAAAGAGYMVHDEATEKDGEFDPLEKVFDEDDGEKDAN